MYCIKCGTQINNNDTYCYNCGAMQNRTTLNKVPVQQPVVVQQPIVTNVPPTFNQPVNQQYVPYAVQQPQPQPVVIVQSQPQPVQQHKKPKNVIKTAWFWILCGVASMLIFFSAIGVFSIVGSYDGNDYNKENPFEYSPEDFQDKIEEYLE